MMKSSTTGWSFRSLIPFFFFSLPLLFRVSAAEGDTEKGERIAAGVRQNPVAYVPLNVSLIGELALGRDLEIADPIITRQGELLTADLFVKGSFAYVGSFSGVVHIIDISHPEQMVEVARIPTRQPAVDVKIHGDILTIGVQGDDADFGIVLADVTDPAHPVVLSEYFESGWRGVHNLFPYNDRIYLAHTNSPGISILDISTPDDPVKTGFWRSDDFSNVVHDIFIRDGLAFVSDFADFSGGLIILDLENPDDPQVLSGMKFDQGLHSAWKEGDYVYANQEFGSWEQPLRAIDVSNPRSPVEVGTFTAGGPPDVEILGPHNPHAREGFQYWAYYDAGLRVFDLSNPSQPVQVGYYPTSLAWGAHAHDDGVVYVADSIQGLLALKFQPPIATAVKTDVTDEPGESYVNQNYPNPFNSGTVIEFTLSGVGETELAIFNLLGQRVRTLKNGIFEAGNHAVSWNGQDDRGADVATGVYVYRLRSGKRSMLRRLVLVR